MQTSLPVKEKVHKSTARSLPWWTWVAPLVICFLGARLSQLFQTSTVFADIYWPLPLGLVMTLWWGPRALAGIFLSSLLNAPLWGITQPGTVLVSGIIDTFLCTTGWLIFEKLGRGKAGLPNFRQLGIFLLSNMGPVAIINGFAMLGVGVLLGYIPADQFLSLGSHAWLGFSLDLLMVAVPLLAFITPHLSKRGWLRSSEKMDVLAAFPSSRRSRWNWLELGLMLGGLIAASFIPQPGFRWPILGLFTLWAATRFGFGMTILVNIAIQAYVIFLPRFFPQFLPVLDMNVVDAQMTAYLNMVIPGVASLLVGRALSDLLAEVEQRKASEAARRRGEDDLREYADIAAAMQSGLFVYRLERNDEPASLRLVKANPAGCAMLGMEENSIIGKPIAELFPHLGSYDFFAKLAAVAQGSAVSARDQISFANPGSGTVYFAIKTFPLPNRCVGILFDNTTERERSATLVARQRDLSLALSATEDLKTGLETCLQTALDLSGMDSGGIYLLDRPSGDLVLRCHHGLGAAFIAAVERFAPGSPTMQVLNAGGPGYFDYANSQIVQRRAEREEHIGSLAVLPFFYQGTAIGCLNVSSHTQTDIPANARSALESISARMGDWVARMQAEDRLRQREKRFRALIEESSDVILILSAQGKITYASPALRQIRGYASDEYLGVGLGEYFHPDDQGRMRQIFQLLLASPGMISDLSTRLRHKNGGWVWVEGVARNLIHDPDIGGIVVNYHDVTARKREEDVQAARLRLIQFAAAHSLDELLQATLDEIGLLTDSPIGFYHFLASDQKTLTLQTWSSITLKEKCTAEGKGRHYNIDEAGVWVECARLRQPLIHNDYATLPNRRGFPPGHAVVQRELVVPVMRSDLIVAILGVGNKPENYDENDVTLVANFADLAWDIAERKQAEDTLARQTQDMTLLYEVGREMSRSLDPRAIYTALYTFILRAMPCDVLVASLFDADSQLIRCTAAWEQGQELDVSGFPPIPLEVEGIGTQSRVIRSGEPLLLNDYAAYSQTARTKYYVGDDSKPVEAIPADAEVPRSALIVPLLLEGRVTGVIQVLSKQKDAFSQNHLRLLQAFSIPAAAAISNAALFAQAQNEIEERRRKEVQLARSERMLHEVVENAPNAILVMQDGQHVFANPAGQKALGYLAEEFSGLNALAIIHPDDRAKVRERIARITRGDANPPSVVTFVRKDGSTYLGEAASVPIEYNQRPAALILIRDITEQHRAEEALRRSEELFRQLADNLPQVLWVRDLSSERIEYVNPAYEKVFGRSRQSLYDARQTYLQAIHPDDLERVTAAFSGQYLLNAPFEIQFRLLRPDGEERWARAHNYELKDEQGQIYRLFGMVEDITESRLREAELRASLEEKNALIKEIHHRVKNNMQVMISLIGLQAQRVSDENVRQMFHESEGRIRSMAMVHEQLYRSTSLSSIDFAAYLERLAWDLYGSFNIYSAVELSVTTQPVTLSIEQAIPCGLLVNEIITNAFKHAFPQQRSGRVEIELEQQEEWVRVRIHDDGAGIPAEIDLEQAETMGLKLINLLTRQVNGEMSVERNQGTTFILRFKLNP
jgi:PAS domain S-box-containing protein